MKQMKKIMALIIAMVMVLGTVNMAFAESDSQQEELGDPVFAVDRSISISGLDEGDTVNFYKVLIWATDSDTADANKAVSGWYWAEPFATVFDVNGDKGSAKLKAAINDDNQLIITDELAGDIARALNGRTVTPVNGNTAVAETNGTATYTFRTQDSLYTGDDGLYMAIVTPADQDVVYNPVFVHLDSSTTEDAYTIVESAADYMNTPVGTGAAKKSRVTLTKEAHNEADYTPDDGDTTKPGDVLDFTVTSTIPGYGDTFQHPFFNLTDQMNGLKLKHGEGEITVTVGGQVLDAGANTYTLTATDDYYTISFAEAYLTELHAATDFEVSYQAEVKEGANTNVIKEKNTVVLEFSHDPTTENDATPGGEKQYKKDITNHYTFSIDANNLVGPYEDRVGESGSEIIKIAVDKNGNPITSEKTWSNVTTNRYQAGPLAGAQFELLDKNKNSFSPKKIATSDGSGRLNFTGLDAGEYWLQEIKAPAGYVKQSDPVKITITATLEDKEITEYYDQQGNWYETAGEGRTAFTYHTDELKSYSVTYGETASSYTFDHVHESNNGEIKWGIHTSEELPQSIPNTKGVELPSTGGVGTTLFYVIGCILVLGAGILLVTRRRVNVN